MMMKALEAGGLPVVTDVQRVADVDNPQGYYEIERVKQLDKGDTAWVAEAQGQVVKVISALLEHLPPGYQYRVVFMQRALPRCWPRRRRCCSAAASPPTGSATRSWPACSTSTCRRSRPWLRAQPNFQVLTVHYNRMLADPWPTVHQVNQLGRQK